MYRPRRFRQAASQLEEAARSNSRSLAVRKLEFLRIEWIRLQRNICKSC